MIFTRTTHKVDILLVWKWSLVYLPDQPLAIFWPTILALPDWICHGIIVRNSRVEVHPAWKQFVHLIAPRSVRNTFNLLETSCHWNDQAYRKLEPGQENISLNNKIVLMNSTKTKNKKVFFFLITLKSKPTEALLHGYSV